MASGKANKDDDSLDALLRSTRPRARAKSIPGPALPGAPRGVNPVDLLFLPTGQRKVAKWLSRRKKAQFDEIWQALEIKPDQVAEILHILEEAGYVHKALVDGKILYQLTLKGIMRRPGRDLAIEIWDRIAPNNAAFLGQVSLFQDIPPHEREKIASQLKERHYERNEVILWQGAPAEHLYLIKRGMVGVSRLSARDCIPHILAYLGQGQVLGELGLLVTRSATATVTALSRVQMLLMERHIFFDLLDQHSGIAVELARILAQRLSDTNARLVSRTAEVYLCVLLDVGDGRGITTLGPALALTLAHMTKQQTVYTEYPVQDRPVELLGSVRDTEPFYHPGGYVVFTPGRLPGLPPSVCATLLLDQLINNYTNIVIGLPGSIGDSVACILERADQVAIVTPPDSKSWTLATELCMSLRAFICPERTPIFTVVHYERRKYDDVPAANNADFEIPFLENPLASSAQRYDDLPAPLVRVTRALAESLGRTNQISVYIPATIDVDRRVDTTDFVEKTLALLGRLFGGATSAQAQGVWHSDKVGLVSEPIHVVHSFATQNDLNRYLSDVIEYVESLKQELRQEAMALKINGKLMLI